MTGSTDTEYIHGRMGASTRASGSMASSMETASTGRPRAASAAAAGRKASVAIGLMSKRKLVKTISPTKSEYRNRLETKIHDLTQK